MTDQEKAEAVLAIVDLFIGDNDITCPEAIYQSDRVIQNAYEFIESLCDVAGYADFEENE